MTAHLSIRSAANSHAACNASSRLRIIVLGYIVRGPIGGMAWHHLQYVLGLKRLGHVVHYLEDSDDYPSCYDPSTHQVGIDPSYGLRFAEHAFERIGLGDCWAYYDAHRPEWHGPVAKDALRKCAEADIVVNISGVNPLRAWLEQVPLRVLVDTDPAFTQVRHLTDVAAHGRAMQHNAFFSFGELIECGESTVPNDGFFWRATRQPVVLDAWPVTDGPVSGPFTTVMQWDSYPSVEFDGKHFGMKSESFQMIRRIPSHVDVPLELALGGNSAPRRELGESGWRLVDPLAVTRDPWTYQEYLRKSRGEFGVAKHGYVATRSGWFSERTACYLAMGRPAVVEDTGFSRIFACGAGLWAFRDVPSAIDALHQATTEYRKQCRAAREIASEYFDSDRILSSLLERACSAAGSSSKGVGHEA